MDTARLLAAVMLAATWPATAQVNPMPRQYPAESLGGRWNGVNLELRSNCTSAQNNGNRGTYAQFDANFASTGDFAIAQIGVTGLNCEYRGRYQAAHGMELQGNYSCTDGKQGTFMGNAGPFGASLLHIALAIKLTGSESCDIRAVLNMARLLP
jgi:hypothetical protein